MLDVDGEQNIYIPNERDDGVRYRLFPCPGVQILRAHECFRFYSGTHVYIT